MSRYVSFGPFPPLATSGEPSESWLGRKILFRRFAPVNTTMDEEGFLRRESMIQSMVPTVTKEHGNWIRVDEQIGNDWISKDDVVLLEQAPAYFTQWLMSYSKSDFAYGSRAFAWRELGELDKALADFGQALRLNPNEMCWYLGRADVHTMKEEYEQAAADACDAIRVQPERSAGYQMRAEVRIATQDWQGSLADYAEYLRLDPNSWWAHARLASILSVCPAPGIRDPSKALECAMKACELTGWNSPYCLEVLAGACAAAGRVEEAIRWQTKALDDPEYEKTRGAAARLRIKLYEGGTYFPGAHA